MNHAILPDRACGTSAEASPLAILRAYVSGAARNIEPDQHVTIEGARRDAVIGVVSGLLRCFRVTPDGRRHVTRFVRAGGFVGLGSHDFYRNSAEAIAKSAIIAFPARALDASAERNVSVRRAVLHAMTAEMAARDRVQFRLGSLWADERVADFLLELSDEFGGKTASRSISMSRGDIADHLGVTIETVSRALHRFQKLGFVQLEGARRFTILRSRDLRGFAAGDSDDFPQPSKMPDGPPASRTMCAA